MHAAVGSEQLHGDKVTQQASAAELSHRADQIVWPPVHAEDEAVEEDEVRASAVQVIGAQEGEVLDGEDTVSQSVSSYKLIR